jgi:small subunit ribosomal protein S16
LAVRIRLTRIGATKRPSYRVVAIDSRRARDGRPLEILGHYDPLTEPATVQLDEARIREWMSKGAQPSETVVKLLKQAGAPASAESAPAKAPANAPAKPRARRAKTEQAAE